MLFGFIRVCTNKNEIYHNMHTQFGLYKGYKSFKRSLGLSQFNHSLEKSRKGLKVVFFVNFSYNRKTRDKPRCPEKDERHWAKVGLLLFHT